ncbi:MAG: hypothetical protein Q9221_007115 [Calogaya cf. arnoldii]
MQSVSENHRAPSVVHLCQSIEAIIEAEQAPYGSDVDTFRLEVHTLNSKLNLIERVRSAAVDRLQVEEAHLKDVNQLLLRCQRILQKLLVSLRNTAIQGDNTHEPRDLNGPGFALPRVYISFFTRTLHMALMTFTLIHHWKLQMPRDSFVPEWGQLSDAIKALRDSVTQRRRFTGIGDSEECVEERGLLRDVEECMKSAEESMVMTRTQENSDATLSRFPLPPTGTLQLPIRKGSSVGSSQPDSRTDEQASDDSDGESIAEPEPDVDAAFTAEVYASIIAHLCLQLERDLSTQDYRRAEKTYKIMERRYLDRETNLGIRFDNRPEQREKLAEIYLNQGRYHKAKKVLSQLLRQTPLQPDRKWRLYYLLAHAYYGLRRLSKAETFANGSLTGRDHLFGKIHPLTEQSAMLVISILQTHDDDVTAMALRRWYCPHTIPPPPPKSVLRKTQAAPGQREASGSPQSPNGHAFSHFPQSRADDEESSHQSNHHVRWAPDVWVGDSGINAPTESGKTKLIEAINSGDEQYVELILRRNPSVEATCVDLISPLMHAVIFGHKGIVEALLTHGAQVDTPISGWTPLHQATDAGNLAIMQLLLGYKADIEAKAPFEYRPPITAQERYRAIAQDKPDPTVFDEKEHRWTPLLRAASKGDEPAVRLLLDRGADIHARSPTNGTPLLHACETMHLATVDLLLMRGSNIHAFDEFGWTPLHRALLQRTPEPPELLQRLVDQGCDVDARGQYRKTPLHFAVERSDALAVNFLLRNGADIEARNAAEQTPLRTAIEVRSEAMVRLLLSLDADAMAMDRDERDAEKAACHVANKSPEIIKLLKEHKGRIKKESSSTRKTANGKGGESREASISIGGSRNGSVGNGNANANGTAGEMYEELVQAQTSSPAKRDKTLQAVGPVAKGNSGSLSD